MSSKNLEAEAKQVASRMYQAMGQHDVNAFDDIFAEDVTNHGMQGQGLEQTKQEMAYWLTAFPDLKIDIEHMIAEGSMVVTRYTGRGTHKGPMGPVAATGKKIEVVQTDFLRIENGKIVEGWYLPDLYSLFLQLGSIKDVFAEG